MGENLRQRPRPPAILQPFRTFQKKLDIYLVIVQPGISSQEPSTGMTVLSRHRPCCPASDPLRWRRGSFPTPASPQEARLCKGPCTSLHGSAPFLRVCSTGVCRAFPFPAYSPCPRRPPSQTLLLQPLSLTWSPPVLAGLCTLCVQTCGEGSIYTWATGHIYTVHIYIYTAYIYMSFYIHIYIVQNIHLLPKTVL